MSSRSRLAAVALASLLAGAAGTLAISFANPFAPRARTTALAKTWDQPWTFTTTTGPRPDGRGTIVGGTGEFEGITGSFVEVTHLKRFTPDGQLALTMELQLAYRKAQTAATGSRSEL